MGNVSTRVGVSAKEREEILKEMKIKAEEIKQAVPRSPKPKKISLPALSGEDRKRKRRTRDDKTTPGRKRVPTRKTA
jgi:hypothetical protein